MHLINLPTPNIQGKTWILIYSKILGCFRLQKSLPAHPNIVRVADAFQTPDEIVAVAEFVPGELHKQFDIFKASRGVANKGDGGKGLPESRLVICKTESFIPIYPCVISCFTRVYCRLTVLLGSQLESENSRAIGV